LKNQLLTRRRHNLDSFAQPDVCGDDDLMRGGFRFGAQ
jgi:hypothetical protein